MYKTQLATLASEQKEVVLLSIHDNLRRLYSRDAREVGIWNVARDCREHLLRDQYEALLVNLIVLSPMGLIKEMEAL